MKDKKNETEVTVKVNYLNVILFAVFSIMLMYGAVYFIYKGREDANKKNTEEALANAVLQTTPVVTTTEETTTDPYLYEYLDTFDSAQVSAKSAILYDKTANKILFEKNPDDRCYPASTTKLVTAIVALENVSPETVFTVGTEIQLIGENSSTAYLVEGSTLTLNDLIYAMLLPSGNDAAYTVAVNTARIVSDNPQMTDAEAVSYFCDMMNKFADDMGMEGTHFANPDGWYKYNHYVTAKDMLKIAIKSMDYMQIETASSSKYYEIKDSTLGTLYTWYNNNKFIIEDSEFYFPYATGLKTGFTDEAGYCYVASATKDGQEVIALMFGSATLEDRYRDARNLFNTVFEPGALVTAPPETSAEIQ